MWLVVCAYAYIMLPCFIFNLFSNLQGSLRRVDTRLHRDAVDFDKQRMIVVPILRLVFSLTSLIDTSEFLEVPLHTFVFLTSHFHVGFFFSFF